MRLKMHALPRDFRVCSRGTLAGGMLPRALLINKIGKYNHVRREFKLEAGYLSFIEFEQGVILRWASVSRRCPFPVLAHKFPFSPAVLFVGLPVLQAWAGRGRKSP
jgi:hypothetical protein